MAPTAVIDVAAGLVFRKGRLLITQRIAGAHLGGLWEFPGGKLEPGESWEAGLVRELREELGIEVSVGRMLAEVTHAYPEKTVRLRFLVCALRAGEPAPLECAALAWVTAPELRQFRFPPADQRLLRQLPDAPEFSGESF
jgi:8-oxo-dGTP diphosphatase